MLVQEKAALSRKPLSRLLVASALAVTAVLASLTMSTAANAGPNGYQMWSCNGGDACTRVAGAPDGGVKVLDRTTNTAVTWRNGTSVWLGWWYRDRETPGKCGVGGDPYVWKVYWLDSSGHRHEAFIGDYYLATGSVSQWGNWPTANGGNYFDDRFAGWGEGTCNVFP